MQKIQFTKTKLDALVGGDKRTYYNDAEQKGLRLAVTPTGSKSYQFQARSSILAKVITVTIGKYEDLSITDARKIAAKLLTEIRAGEDPQRDKVEKRKEATLNDVFQDFIKHHAKHHKRTWEADVAQYNKHFKDSIGKKRVGDITQVTVTRWMNNIADYSGQTSANRCHALLSSIYNNTIRVASPELPNPCRGIKRYHEESRDRYLLPEELERFHDAVNQEEEIYRDIIQMLLLTGQRKSNVFSMRYEDVKGCVWVIPSTSSKNKKPLHIPLVKEALNILKRRSLSSDSPWVFPSPKKEDSHIKGIERAWMKITLRSGLEDLHIHDLRRTLGSYQAMMGASMLVIGNSLGHLDQRATAVYAHLQQDPVLQSMQSATDKIFLIENKED